MIFIIIGLFSGYSVVSFARAPEAILFSVNVYDSTSLAPLSQARITILQNKKEIETGITNSNGQAKFVISNEGDYTIKINASGYNQKDTSMHISAVNISLSFFISTRVYSTEEIEVIGKEQNAFSYRD